MKVAIFQPTYLPWLGFFKAIDWADKFVFLDDVQFEHHSWQHRNKIKSSQGELMLTVPIVRNFGQAIKEVKINYTQDWTAKHLKSIEQNYSKAPYFKDFFPRLEFRLNSRPERLIDLTVCLIKDIGDYLGLKTDFYYASDLGAGELHRNDKIIAILKKLQADTYLHAEGAREYMQDALGRYQENNIELISLNFVHPRYYQPYGEFVSHLSVIDVIFNCGRQETAVMLNNIKLFNG